MSSKDSKSPNGEQVEPKKEFVKTYTQQDSDDYGYFFYPHRSPGKVQSDDFSVWRSIKDGLMLKHRYRDTLNCRVNVRKCANKNPKVKMMLRALEAHGCPVNLDRHIQCEPCRSRVAGGFDYTTNQIVVCENTIKNQSQCCTVLAHEMLHAFDQCRSKMDMRNLDHMACTEIRASNLFHCGLMESIVNRDVSPMDAKNKHQNCVRNQALLSVLMVRNVEESVAKAAVERVFDRCYTDLEPFGRRLLRGTKDAEQSLRDGLLYGYTQAKAEFEVYKPAQAGSPGEKGQPS